MAERRQEIRLARFQLALNRRTGQALELPTMRTRDRIQHRDRRGDGQHGGDESAHGRSLADPPHGMPAPTVIRTGMPAGSKPSRQYTLMP